MDPVKSGVIGLVVKGKTSHGKETTACTENQKAAFR